MTINRNVINGAMRMIARNAAVFWTQYIRPLPYSDMFVVGDVRVEIRISERERNTKPLGVSSWDEQRAEQGSEL